MQLKATQLRQQPGGTGFPGSGNEGLNNEQHTHAHTEAQAPRQKGRRTGGTRAMNDFTKLKSTILRSSVWGYSSDIRIVWITLLALSDRTGFVECTVPGLAREAVVPIDVVEAALKIFLSPDEYSADPSNDGRRIRAVPRGWVLLNYRKHRERALAEDRREYQRDWIESKRSSVTVESVSTECRQLSTALSLSSPSSPSLRSLSDPSETEEINLSCQDPSESGAEPPGEPSPLCPDQSAIEAELRKWPVFADQDFFRLTMALYGIMIASAKKLEWVLEAIAAAGGKLEARIAGGEHLAKARIAETVAGYVTRASEARQRPPGRRCGAIPRQTGEVTWKPAKEIS
jgi:hypothetical protein